MGEMSRHIRVVSWNVHNRIELAAERVGHYISVVRPHLALLQEVNAASVSRLLGGSGLDWLEVAPLSTFPAPKRGPESCCPPLAAESSL